MNCRAALLLAAVSALLLAQDPVSDARQDRTTVIFEGKSPDQLACDTMLRRMPDGSWVMVMLGGGDTEPLPANDVFLTRSLDEGRTWSPLERVDLGVKSKNPVRALVPTELSVHSGRATLFVANHDGTFHDWTCWMTTSTDSGRTWPALEPVPAAIHRSTFMRNLVVLADGTLVLPFQHYEGERGPVNPRNGVLRSRDGGRSWTVHGAIRLSDDDGYRGFAENNVVEIVPNQLAMLIRADRLGGVLYRADSKDGGRTWSRSFPTDIPNPGSKFTLYNLGFYAGKDGRKKARVAILHNPNPKQRNPLSLWVSFDGMETWSYRRDLVTTPGRLNYPDGFVSAGGRYLHFAFDDNRRRAVYYGARLP